ncbi:hypothetical protein PP460_gp140 [Streptomyces phage Muntaha]|uniref:Uncharacterized protein n=1 Tax=Streptomyces phage Muntaha TaxID=2713269 RepID=A0A6G8R395_9CAUD|nr:hypothetical protein PP460_gp140 [Streptomyces phage Muntaha]QIN94662.1 hypothetical protein SEA_MUNTAHA_128 [Streptomyces phage Muntaha]
MKAKNQYIYSDDEAYLSRLEEEYALLGRRTKRESGRLIVFALARKGRKAPPRRRK